MADDIVKDYLGHPCKIAEAFALFPDSVDEARKTAAQDPRALYRQIGIALVDGRQRIQHLVPAVEALIAALPDSTDDDQALAIAEMLRHYVRAVDDGACDLSGLVLAGLEQAGAIKDAGQEVAA